MAEEKRGFLQGILQRAPVIGAKREEEGLPAKGPVPVHIPTAYAADKPWTGPDSKTRMGWFPHRIKYKGLFDLDGLYKVMALWFKEKRFELHETLYKSKPPELELRWTAERRRTSWVKEIVTVYAHMWGEYNVEVIVDGKKKRMAKVRMIITINGDIESPYADIFGRPRWTANNLERRLSQVFRKWIMKREMEGLYWDRLYYELYDLYGVVKDYLKFGAR